MLVIRSQQWASSILGLKCLVSSNFIYSFLNSATTVNSLYLDLMSVRMYRYIKNAYSHVCLYLFLRVKEAQRRSKNRKELILVKLGKIR